MSEPVVGDSGGAALEKKMKQEQEGEESHRVIVHFPPQQKLNRPDLSAAVAVVPYKTRVLKQIMRCIGALSFTIAFGIVVGAILRNKEIDGYLHLTLAFFVISMFVAFFMDAATNHRQTTTVLVISITTSILGWGFLAFVLIMNHGSSSCSSAFTLCDLEIFFRALIVAIPHWIFRAFMNLNRP